MTVGQDCEAHTNCSSCLTEMGCGWCDTSQMCFPGEPAGPFCFDCHANDVGCSWATKQCPVGYEEFDFYKRQYYEFKALSEKYEQLYNDTSAKLHDAQTQLDEAHPTRRKGLGWLSIGGIVGMGIAVVVVGAVIFNFRTDIVQKLRGVCGHSGLEEAWRQLEQPTAHE
mmetsp:Transcript_71526/g.168530  ORF Transcript_71526/g.168530 Transcript_71526/m.168530 type:complete len:168 (+) Transcript_71526:94-597(+)